MSNSTGDSDGCISEEAGRMGGSMIAFTVLGLMITPLLIVSGAVLWWKHKENTYLSRRNPTLVAFTAIPLFADMLAAHLYRISLNENLYFASCGFSNFWFIFVALSLFIPNTCRIISFHFRVEYHKTLAKIGSTLEVKNLKASSSQYSAQTMLIAASRANPNFTIKIAIIMFLIVVFCSFGYVFLTCPIAMFGTDNCIFGFVSEPIVAVFLIPFVPLVLLNIYFGRLVKEAPDPFHIKKEIDVFHIFVSLGVAIMILDAIDPGDLAKRNSDEKISFKYVLLNDYLIYAVFAHAVHYQVYKAIQLDGPFALSTLLSFDELLCNNAAKDLFRLFLQSEFSVENLVAYELMARWKTRFHESNREMRMNEAKNIFRVWIDPSSDSAIGLNVSYMVMEELANDLKNLHEYPETLFDKVLQDLHSLMENDSFIRFTHSNEYKSFVGFSDPTALNQYN